MEEKTKQVEDKTKQVGLEEKTKQAEINAGASRYTADSNVKVAELNNHKHKSKKRKGDGIDHDKQPSQCRRIGREVTITARDDSDAVSLMENGRLLATLKFCDRMADHKPNWLQNDVNHKSNWLFLEMLGKVNKFDIPERSRSNQMLVECLGTSINILAIRITNGFGYSQFLIP